MLTGSKRPASGQEQDKRASSAQKQRDKKKLSKLADKKGQRDKLREILDTLQKQQVQTDKSVDKSVMNSFHSSKDLGNIKRRQKQEMKAQKFKERQKNAPDVEIENFENESKEADVSDASSDGNAEAIHSTGFTVNDQDNKLQPKQSYDYIAKITEMYSNKKKKSKDNDGDTSDEQMEMQGIKKQANQQGQGKRFQSLQDKRITFINECDAKQFKNNQKVLVGQSEDDFLADDPDKFKTKTSKVRGLNQDL